MFTGPSIIDTEMYAVNAWLDYGVDTTDLLMWRFEEYAAFFALELPMFRPRESAEICAPPHHFFDYRKHLAMS